MRNLPEKEFPVLFHISCHRNNNFYSFAFLFPYAMFDKLKGWLFKTTAIYIRVACVIHWEEYEIFSRKICRGKYNSGVKLKAGMCFLVGYLTKLSISPLYNVEWWMTNRDGFGRKRMWSNGGTNCALAWTDWERPRNPSVRIVGVPVEIREERFPNTRLELCRKASLFSGKCSMEKSFEKPRANVSVWLKWRLPASGMWYHVEK
jgi:hypothetical protein